MLAPSLVAGRLDRFLTGHPDAITPFLVVDLDVVRRQYVSLTAALPGTEVFYTVKANPAPEVLRLRIKLGFKLRVASRWMPAPVTLPPHTLPGSAWSAPRKDRKHRRETG
jgi:hypothetical protein